MTTSKTDIPDRKHATSFTTPSQIITDTPSKTSQTDIRHRHHRHHRQPSQHSHHRQPSQHRHHRQPSQHRHHRQTQTDITDRHRHQTDIITDITDTEITDRHQTLQTFTDIHRHHRHKQTPCNPTQTQTSHRHHTDIRHRHHTDRADRSSPPAPRGRGPGWWSGRSPECQRSGQTRTAQARAHTSTSQTTWCLWWGGVGVVVVVW